MRAISCITASLENTFMLPKSLSVNFWKCATFRAYLSSLRSVTGSRKLELLHPRRPWQKVNAGQGLKFLQAYLPVASSGRVLHQVSRGHIPLGVVDQLIDVRGNENPVIEPFDRLSLKEWARNHVDRRIAGLRTHGCLDR